MPGALPADGPGDTLGPSAACGASSAPLLAAVGELLRCAVCARQLCSVPIARAAGTQGLSGAPLPPSQGLEHFHPFLRGPVNLGHGRICSKGEVLLPNQAPWLINTSLGEASPLGQELAC